MSYIIPITEYLVYETCNLFQALLERNLFLQPFDIDVILSNQQFTENNQS